MAIIGRSFPSKPIYLRGARAPFVAPIVPEQFHVVLVPRPRPTPGHIVFIRNPITGPALSSSALPYVVLQMRDRAVPKGAVQFLRSPFVTVPPRGAPPPKVVLQPRRFPAAYAYHTKPILMTSGPASFGFAIAKWVGAGVIGTSWVGHGSISTFTGHASQGTDQ